MSVVENQVTKDTKEAEALSAALTLVFTPRSTRTTATFPRLVTQSWWKQVEENQIRDDFNKLDAHRSPCDQVGSIQGCLTELANVIAKLLICKRSWWWLEKGKYQNSPREGIKGSMIL